MCVEGKGSKVSPPDFESPGGSCSFFHFFDFMEKAFDLYGRITLYRVIAVSSDAFFRVGHIFWKPPKTDLARLGPQEGA